MRRTLEISGRGNVVRFETAGELHVRGLEHDLTGEGVRGLDLSGSANQVRTALRGPAPGKGRRAVVQVRGARQSVDPALETPVRLEVSGADNRVEWETAPGVAAPSLQVRGTRQVVRRK